MDSAGFYIYSTFALVFWEQGVLTLFSRVGSVILALHEGSDVFLEIAKLSKYCGFEMLAGIAFVSYVLSWTLMVRMLVKQIQARGKVDDDVRSDSEGKDDEHED
ncbi:hypothetical protein C1H46_044554 [Malus baccata]|uniref:TLC domain-containing protein n=1 Tax=Malus baccata TaxID=106549 RepID=A0A540K7P2_MALBA|nr:hypothetical protein C1H46_044554 [Malus baccata]